MTAPDEPIIVVRRHQDIVEVFRMMKERLGLTNEFIDNAGGLTKGHSDKILGPGEARKWGPTTFDLFCEMFAIELRVHVDLEAAKRMEAVWERRTNMERYKDMPGRVSKKMIERAKPHVMKEAGRAGGIATASKHSAALRSEMAQKAGRARMANVTKEQRSAMNRKGWETRRKAVPRTDTLLAGEH